MLGPIRSDGRLPIAIYDRSYHQTSITCGWVTSYARFLSELGERELNMFIRAISVVAAVSMQIPSSALGAELVVMSSVAARGVMDEIGPQFERASGIVLHFRYDTAVALQHAIEDGARFDVAVLTPPVISA